MLKPKLDVGDKIVLIEMTDEYSSVPPLTKGVVVSVSEVLGDTQYSVKWENGSRLALLTCCDQWVKEDYYEKIKKLKKEKLDILKKKDITENSEYEKSKVIMKNIDVFKHFNMRFLYQYLKMIRESGIVNMLGASPYLYMGRDRIKHEFEYKDIPHEDEFEKVLENANQSQAEMINGVIKVLESEKKETSLENINRYLNRYSNKVLMNYIHLQ